MRTRVLTIAAACIFSLGIPAAFASYARAQEIPAPAFPAHASSLTSPYAENDRISEETFYALLALASGLALIGLALAAFPPRTPTRTPMPAHSRPARTSHKPTYLSALHPITVIVRKRRAL